MAWHGRGQRGRSGGRPLGRRAAVRVLADGGRGALSGARVRQRTVLHHLRAPPAALVDLLCWSAARVHRLESTMRVLGQQLVKVAFLPALHPAGDHTSLACGFVWRRPEKARLFTPEALAAAGVEDLIDPGLRPRAAARRGHGRVRSAADGAVSHQHACFHWSIRGHGRRHRCASAWAARGAHPLRARRHALVREACHASHARVALAGAAGVHTRVRAPGSPRGRPRSTRGSVRTETDSRRPHTPGT